MKKFFSLLGIGVVIVGLSACSLPSSTPELSYEDAYDVFVDNLFSAEIFSQLKVLDSFALEDELFLGVDGGSDDMDLTIDVAANSRTDTLTANSETSVVFDVFWYDAVKKLPLELSGALDIKFLDGNLYAYIDSFAMDSGPGNAEANLISLVIGNYLQKWILMDDPNTIEVQRLDSSKLLQTYILPNTIKDALSIYDVFVLEGEDSIGGTPAYKLSLHSGQLLALLESLDVLGDVDFSTMEIVGNMYLLVNSEDDVSLVLDTIGIADANGYMSGENLYEISGELDAYSIDLLIENKVDDTEMTFFFGQKRKVADLRFAKENHLGEKNEVNLDIEPYLSGNNLSFDIEGEIIVSPMQFYKPVVLDLEATYTIEAVTDTGFEVPENVLLLHQILGDQFALPAMMEENSE